MLLVALAAVTWGTIGVAVAVLYRLTPLDALTVGFWRLVISAPPLLVLSRVYAGPNFWRVQRRDVGPLMLMGAAFAAYQLCYFAAIPYIGLAAAVLVNICSAPIIVAVLSGVFLKERLTPLVGVVLITALSGTALLVGGSPEAESPRALLVGGALALGAGFSYSLVALTARVVAPRYHPVQPIALAFMLSALLLAPIVLARGIDLRYSPTTWFLLLYLGLVPTALGYSLYLRGMKTTPATISTIIALLEPLISTLVALTPLLGERLSLGGVAGGLLLLGSVVVLIVSQSQNR